MPHHFVPHAMIYLGEIPKNVARFKEMRDEWWALVDERNRLIVTSKELSDNLALLNEEPENINLLKERNAIALYHCVFANEDFTVAAQQIYQIVLKAQQVSPNLRRLLFLDIEGHRNQKGRFDAGMFELQRHFILGFLLSYLSEVHIPLIAAKNNKRQRNDLAQNLTIFKGPIDLQQLPAELDEVGIYQADRGRWFKSQQIPP